MEASLKHFNLAALIVKSIEHENKLTTFIKRKQVILCLIYVKLSEKYPITTILKESRSLKFKKSIKLNGKIISHS